MLLTSVEPDRAEAADEALRISSGLVGLPVEQREVVMLRVYDGLTFPQIAERTEAPLGTVHSRFRSGLERLRAALKETP